MTRRELVLSEALKPFADLYDKRIHPKDYDGELVSTTMGDCRRAYEVLAAEADQSLSEALKPFAEALTIWGWMKPGCQLELTVPQQYREPDTRLHVSDVLRARQVLAQEADSAP